MPSPRPRHVAALLTSAPALLLATAAHAGPAEEAQRHADEGAKRYIAGDCPGAIVEFQKAYEAQPAPLLLYNIAICYQSLDEHERAREALDRALAHTDRSPKEDAAAQARLSALDAIARGRALATPALVKRVEDPGTQVALDAPAPLTPTWYTGLTWGALGVGAIGVSGALLIDYTLSDDLDAYNAARPDRRVSAAQAEAIRADQRLGKGMLFTGLALGAVGVGLLLLNPFDEEAAPDQGARLDLAITPDHQQVTLTLPW